MAPSPRIPLELLLGAFHRRTALAAGLTSRQLQSRCWIRLFPQVYIHCSVRLTDEVRLAAMRLAAPADAVVTGYTAAWLYGVWQPPPGQLVPLELGVPRDRTAARGRSLRTHTLVLDPIDINAWHDIPITSPERTCFGLMARSELVEAVVFADAFGHAGLVTWTGLMRYADERPHWPHVRKARFATDLSRFEAASPMETRLRMVIVLAGLPEPPLVNGALYDERGVLMGIPDLGYFQPIFGLEYDSAYHHTAEQRAADNVRENRLLVGQVPLLRYGPRDVFVHPDRIERDVAAMLGGRSLRHAS
jgi:hypothetical protein